MVKVLQIGRREQLIVLIILAAVLFGGGYRYALYKAGATNDQPALVSAAEDGAVEAKDIEAKKNDTKTKEIVVHVSGEVEKPGVYRLLTGDRVIDAVEMAQPKAEADLDSLNLAAPLTDGQKIPVPAKMAAGAQPLSQTMTGTGQVNINTADLSQLDTLPGIGPSLAQRIIDYRQANGGFKTVDDLKNVSGIGDKKYEDLKDMISTY